MARKWYFSPSHAKATWCKRKEHLALSTSKPCKTKCHKFVSDDLWSLSAHWLQFEGFDTLLAKLNDTFHSLPSRSWYFDTFHLLQSRSWRFWYFSVPSIKIVEEQHHKVENQIVYDLGSTIKLKCMVKNIIIVIFIKIIMMIINIRWRTSWGSSRSTSSGRRATGCSTMTWREEASGVLLLLQIFLSINFHF